MEYKYKITVITPTYNRADFLPQTIESILNQTYTNFEYYILDDGSTDNTKEVVEPYLKDKRVKYLYHENAGEPTTVNWGWSLAKGEYFTQINSDDIVDKDLFKEIVKVMDENKDKIVAYTDYNFIDENNNIILKQKNIDWNFIDALLKFSCYPAMVGTFIRKSALENWNYIRTNKYKYINDIEMYWSMALVGDFIHIPKNLVSWRQHKGQISVDRIESIKEVEEWFNEYFERKDLPEEVINIKDKVRETIVAYFINLAKNSSLDLDKKREIIKCYKKELGFPFANLQVSDNDLIGNKFNGHDLHLYLRENNVDSYCVVRNKLSDDINTFLISNLDNTEYISYLEKKFNIHALSYFETYDLIYNDLFLYSDIIHLHLIHNYMFNLNLLPLMSKLKPIVWTLHDPWLFSGHCIYHFDCDKWQDKCYDCQHLDVPFKMEKDNTAFNFEIKRDIIERSDIHFIVASKWMYNKVKESPICKNKKIYLIPFGINHNIFKPRDIVEAKKELGIDEDSFVVMFRSDKSKFKGLDIIKKSLEKIKSKSKITLITVGQKSLLEQFKNKYKIIEYDWIKDDYLLVKLYQACDIFLMPSKQEAFGMMAIEAMSCGKTVLALEGTVLPDVINSHECGIACKEEEYTEKLQYLIDNPNELIERGKKSLEFAKENYNKDVYVERIIEVYKEVMSNHKIDDRYKFILNQLDKYICNNKFIYDNNISNALAVYNGYKYLKIKILGINLTIKLDKLKRFLSIN